MDYRRALFEGGTDGIAGHRQRGKGTPAVILLLALLLSTILVAGCQSPKDQETQGPPLTLSLATSHLLYSGLIAIADARGFFRGSGLDVSIREYPSGLAAAEALGRGEVQLATAADFVFTHKLDNDPSLRILASIASVNDYEIVARRDRGIQTPADLAGKRVGVTFGTAGEYYLPVFLLANGIDPAAVAAVNIPPGRIVESLGAGEVDAIISWATLNREARSRLGDGAVSWQAQNTQEYHWVLMTREELLRSPEAIRRFLSALQQAEDFLLAHGDEAKAILMESWHFDPGYMQQFWDRSRLRVTLDQSLVISLENCSKWKRTREGNGTKVQNFLDYISTAPLSDLDPGAVTIFR